MTTTPSQRRTAATAAAALALGASLLAGCGGSASTASGGGGTGASSGGTPVAGGTVTFALPPSVTPNYILPIMGSQYYSNVNLYQLQAELFRPLYWFGQGTSPTYNASLSLADAPVYSNGNKTVTITMKPYKWANGQPVTSRDVLFFLNMLKAETSIWPVYVPGEFPDNVTSAVANSPTQLTLTLSGSYSPTWFTANELSQITPLPQAAWDEESVAGPIGNYDQTPAGAAAVYKFLAAQASSVATYTTNPLWKVVDGPFALKTFQTTGYVAMVPNPTYSGPVKPHISELIEQPFTSDSSEYEAVRAGTVDYGYIPAQDTSQDALIASQGYGVDPWIGWGINYFPYNYNNPTAGPIFKQLYFRQAVQTLINQPLDVKKALYGFGYPTYGPVPIKPLTDLTDATEQANPYPFDPTRSAQLLRSNGWDVQPGGTTTCAKPGTGPGECGADIPAGAKLAFNLQYASGLTYLSEEMQDLKSNLATDGIQLTLTQAPFDTVIANAAPCAPTASSCTWQLENWGQGWSYGPDYYPTGESIFETGSGINEGSYSNPTNDANINASHVQSGAGVLHTYEDYLAKQLPVIWQANPDFQISAIRSKLKGVVQSPILNFTPEQWYFTK